MHSNDLNGQTLLFTLRAAKNIRKSEEDSPFMGGGLPINTLRFLTFSIFLEASNYSLKSRPNVGQSAMESTGPTLLNTSFSTYPYHKTHPGDTIT